MDSGKEVCSVRIRAAQWAIVEVVATTVIKIDGPKIRFRFCGSIDSNIFLLNSFALLLFFLLSNYGLFDETKLIKLNFQGPIMF